MEGNVPAYYKDVSLRLFNVLDKVGLREDVRWKRINMMVETNWIGSFTGASNWHIFGSQAEATTTPGLGSDLDLVTCLSDFNVLQSLSSFGTFKGMDTVLVVSDANTPPGYVKLQYVYSDGSLPVFNEQGEFLMDSFGRSVVCHRLYFPANLPFLSVERHGPAIQTDLDSISTTDMVSAIKVTFWPDQASQWENRHRLNNYPSQENISLIKQTGALLVPVGNPLSPEKHLEWRISISYGETLLVWQFNPTQYKCYVLLKMIKKHFVQPICGEKSLSSYHCKTCVFYMLESTPPSLWQPENLLLCVDVCLRTLCRWADNGYCPNYFIPEENMFLGRVYGHIQLQLLAVLHHLLKEEGKYLLRLSCDGIGQMLTSLCQTSLIHSEYRSKDGLVPLEWTAGFFASTIQEAYWKIVCDDKLAKKICYSHKPRRSLDTIFQACCASMFGSNLASKCFSQEVIDQQSLDIAHEFLVLGCFSDVASGKLKLAAFYLMQENLIMTENILNEIKENYTYVVVSYCEYAPEHILCRIVEDNLSVAEFVRQYVAFDVLYLESEIHCMPKELILDIFRSKGSNGAEGYPHSFFGQTRSLVHPRFYLHFLEYQCHFRQGKTPRKMAALNNMLWILKYIRPELKNTALNLFAYCLKQEGMYVDAYKVLCISMITKNKHNAANWQIAFLINAAFRLLCH